MKKIRTALALITMILLMAGYLGSQLVSSMGSSANYVAALDKSGVPYLALSLLLAAVVFAFIPDKEENAQ
ncbi:MAG: hypothetical protein ABUL72_00605 [Armatimonadota bacterium]